MVASAFRVVGVIVVFVVCLHVICNGESWPSNGHDPQNTFASSIKTSTIPKGNISWTITPKVNSGGSGQNQQSRIVIGTDGTIYWTTRNIVYAYTESGSLMWTFNGTTKHGPNSTLSDPLLLEHDSLLLVRNSFELYAIKITSGKKVWNLTLEGKPRLEMKNCLTRNPQLNVIYFLVEKNNTSTLSAFNISNRVMLWQKPAFTQFKDQSLAVSVDGSIVYALNFVDSANATNTTQAQYNQTLKAFSSSTGQLLWTISNTSLSGIAPDARPVVSPQGIVYIPTSNLEAYNMNGTKVWGNYKGPYRTCCSAFSGKNLYVPSYPNYIQTFDSASGSMRSPIPLNYTIRLVVAEAQKLFYVTANNTKGQPGHILYVMDSTNLFLLWQRPFPTCKSLGYPLLGGSATNSSIAYFYCADTDTLYQIK
jgi:hypothetical protein